MIDFSSSARCSEVNSTWLITSELANQRALKAIFICVVQLIAAMAASVRRLKTAQGPKENKTVIIHNFHGDKKIYLQSKKTIFPSQIITLQI